MPGMCAYGVAKAAVIALSEQLRAELHDSGVGVSVVCPAFVQTRLLENFRGQHPEQRAQVERWMERSKVSSEDVAARILDALKRRRFMVLTHPITRRAWRLKRFFPEFYFRKVAAGSRLNAHLHEREEAA